MKKLLSLLLVMALACTLMPAAFAYDMTETLYVDVTFEPLACTFDGITELTLKITNNSETESLSGKVLIEAPAGWALAETSADFSTEAGKSATATFAVTEKTKAPFNFYTFTVRVKDDAKGEVVNAIVPLSFTTIVYTSDDMDIATFDGDMSSWADAYPVVLNAPQYATSYRDWYDSDVAGLMYAKWNEDGIQYIFSIADETFVQTAKNDGIWSNDNIQISIDTLGLESNGYDADDYEIGMAYTTEGMQMWSWHAADASATKGGAWDPSMTTLVRDNDMRITRYALDLPKDHIAPLELKEGTTFGMNYVINDADISSREAAIQLTSGTADGKNPSAYKKFTLVAAETAAEGTVSEAIVEKITDQMPADFDGSTKAAKRTYMFDDVARHWSRKDVENMAKRGIVNGVAEGVFEPDRNITRAEFVALLAKAGIEATEYKGSLSDVKADDWFAGYVQTGIDAGVVPAEMIADDSFKPEEPITREEMCVMVVNMYNYKTGTEMPAGESVFADEASFSAWTVNSVNAAYKAGIVNGVDEVINFAPVASATRAEAVVIVKRLLAKL